MPVRPTYPGVYVEEVPSGVHTIVGVSTSVAAFVDTFARAPFDRADPGFQLPPTSSANSVGWPLTARRVTPYSSSS
jgi:phage tail sheath protein FI